MTVVNDFKKFAMRGNIIDLATGVILGAAFGKIVSSLVEQVIMPPIGFLLSGINFSDLGLVLREASPTAPAVVIGYGKFIQSTVDFVIVSLCIFLFLRLIQRMQKKEEEKPTIPAAEASKTEKLLTEIRDLLQAQGQR